MSARRGQQRVAAEPTPLTDRWRVHQFAQGLSHRTVVEREKAVLLMAADAGCDPAEATTEQIATWLARGQWAGSTRHTYWTHLRAWFLWLVLNGHRDCDPMTALRAPKRPRYVPRPIAPESVARLLGARMWATTRAKLLLAVYQGLRVHEIAKVRGEDFDLEAGTMTVLGKGRRMDALPLHPEVVSLVRRMPSRGYWFPSDQTRTGHVTSRAVGDALADLMQRNGIRGTAHCLRHTYGTQLVRHGADARTAQTLLRHSSLQSTQIYVEASDDAKVRALNNLDFKARVAVSGGVPAEQRVIAMLRERPRTRPEIRSGFSAGERRAAGLAALDALIEQGSVIREGPAGRQVYRLIDDAM